MLMLTFVPRSPSVHVALTLRAAVSTDGLFAV